MNRRIFIFAGVVLAVASFALITFGWSPWASRQRSVKLGATKPIAQQQREDAASSNEPDTRRDVFIPPRRAPDAAEIGKGTWINFKPLNLVSRRSGGVQSCM